MRIALVAGGPSTTNEALAAARVPGVRVEALTPAEALERLAPGDVAVGRLDVLPSVDGVEDGMWALGALEARDVAVLNGPATLLATHDKLITAHVLRRSRIAHPRTRLVRSASSVPAARPPVVVKPRYGSWGRDVVRADDEPALRDALAAAAATPWFRRHGALVQDLVPPAGRDLRVVVAGGAVVGAVTRVCAPGEWRTNVALGATREPVTPPAEAARLAVAAARAVGGALVGVDLLPLRGGGWSVLELNGAVEFNDAYAPGGDVHRAAVAALVARVRSARHPRHARAATATLP
jgi:[lysine-biosynthesis-protein LysW]--L-2-aminoadipate ligase